MFLNCFYTCQGHNAAFGGVPVGAVNQAGIKLRIFMLGFRSLHLHVGVEFLEGSHSVLCKSLLPAVPAAAVQA